MEAGFPVCSYLREHGCQIGRNARMLASHSPPRTASSRQASVFLRLSVEYDCTNAHFSYSDNTVLNSVTTTTTQPTHVLAGHASQISNIQQTSSPSQWWDEWKWGSNGQFLSNRWPHYSTTRIRSIWTPLGTSKSLPGQPRPLCIMSIEVGLAATDVCPCGKLQTKSHWQQLPTDQAGGWAAAIALSW